jgi:hypothetical protein
MSEAPAGGKSAPVPTVSGGALAELIYVELIGRAFLRVDNVAQIKPDPAVLAKLSFDLAKVFKAQEHELLVDMMPKNVGYDISTADWLNK